MRDDELASFQQALLETLAGARDAAEALASLRADPRCAPFRSDVARWEPAMVHAAIELMRRYGKRRV